MSSLNAVIPLPWHYTVWNTWHRAALSIQLPHALLLKGPVGSGKQRFVKAFTNLMLCTQPKFSSQLDGYHACGNCSDCLSYRASTHPNYYELKPKDVATAKPKILIEQVRALTHTLQQTATHRETSIKHHSYQTIVVIESVELLGTAQPAFLKTLEEPRSGVLFLLTSNRLQALDATIKSRCQCVSLPQPSQAQAMDWLRLARSHTEHSIDDNALLMALQLAGNRPLEALAYLKDNQLGIYQAMLESLIDLGLGAHSALATAEQWMQHPLEKVLTYLMQAVNQLVEYQFTKQNSPITHTKMTAFTQQISVRQLLIFWSRLSLTHQQSALYSLNAQIALERLAYTFSNS